MTLTVDTFENAVAQINREANEKPSIYVLNAHDSCRAIVTRINEAIANATNTQLLYQLDLRPIYHANGTPDKWSLEACSPTKSLAITGELPSA